MLAVITTHRGSTVQIAGVSRRYRICKRETWSKVDCNKKWIQIESNFKLKVYKMYSTTRSTQKRNTCKTQSVLKRISTMKLVFKNRKQHSKFVVKDLWFEIRFKTWFKNGEPKVFQKWFQPVVPTSFLRVGGMNADSTTILSFQNCEHFSFLIQSAETVGQNSLPPGLRKRILAVHACTLNSKICA